MEGEGSREGEVRGGERGRQGGWVEVLGTEGRGGVCRGALSELDLLGDLHFGCA